ncbi:hypothetical protein ACIP4W_41035 [Streptomyces sp. NPDC088846]|uniref:hypothetical protein n=1 Tax=Streptomyces sp. NPDC088846 TaxID=3365908 RepID=UPI00382EEEAD
MTTRRRKPIADFVDEEMPSAPTIPRSVRTAPVRVTLDLSPADHRALKRWCNSSAAELDLSQVPLASVLRILGKQLLADQELAARVRAELEQAAGGAH